MAIAQARLTTMQHEHGEVSTLGSFSVPLSTPIPLQYSQYYRYPQYSAVAASVALCALGGTVSTRNNGTDNRN